MYHFVLYVLRVCAQSNGDLGRRMPTSQQLSRRLSTLLQESASVCTEELTICSVLIFTTMCFGRAPLCCVNLRTPGAFRDDMGIHEICQPSAWNHKLIFTISYEMHNDMTAGALRDTTCVEG